jgi:hypothetical protein
MVQSRPAAGILPPSSSGLGHGLLKAKTGVRTPVGAQHNVYTHFPTKEDRSMKAKYTKRASALPTIGNTPLVKLQNIVPDYCATIYIKK